MNIEFLGKLHPLLVHFPIGIIPSIVLFHLLAWKKKAWIKPEGILMMWVMASVTIFLAVILGWINLHWSSDTESFKEGLHEKLGFLTLVLSLVNMCLWYQIMAKEKQWQKYYFSILILISLSIGVGGHLGAELTHGSLNPLKLFESQKDKIEDGGHGHEHNEHTNDQMALRSKNVNFEKNVVPLLKKSCYKCHGEKKQKGKLRLDSYGAIMQGGKHLVVKPYNSQGSLLYQRTILPEDDEDIMPSKGDLLTPKQTKLLKDWIDNGAKQ